MFFVAKEKIGTVLGQQKEYTACTRRGIGFTSHSVPSKPGHSVWHYFWPSDMVEPSVRARFAPESQAAVPPQRDEDSIMEHGEGAPYRDEPTHFIWSQEVAHGEVIGEPVITPYSGEGDWIAEAKRKFNDAHSS